MFRCFVRGLIFGTFASSMAPALSSKILQCILATLMFFMGTPRFLASFISDNNGRTSLIVVDRAMYSASVEERAISVCSFDAHINGQPANRITNPILDFAVVGSFIALVFFHSPSCEASTQQSKELSFGLRMIPLSLFLNRYRPIRLTASP